MPVDASIPLSFKFPKLMTPADTLSLRDMAMQTQLRQAELEDLPEKRAYERESRTLDKKIKLGQLAATEHERRMKQLADLEKLRDSVNEIGYNTVQVAKSRGGFDPTVATENMRAAMVADFDRRVASGELKLLGLDDKTIQGMRAALMQATPEQIEAQVLDPKSLQEQAAYPAAPDAAAPATQPQGGMMPLSGIPNVVNSPQSGVPNPDKDILTDWQAKMLIEQDTNPYPVIPEGATPRERALIENYQAGPQTGPLPPEVPLSQLAQAPAVPRETAAVPQTPWDRLDAEADVLEKRGGKANYERAQNLRKRAEELRDNDRDERRLAAQKEAKFGASKIIVEAEKKGREEAWKSVNADLDASKLAYEGATKKRSNIATIRRAMETGNINIGPLAEWRQGWDRVADYLGLGGKDTEERLKNTADIIRSLASQIVEARQALKGQGQVSDYEGRLLANAEGGELSKLSNAELKALFEMNDRFSRQLWIAHEKKMRNFRNSNLKDLAPFKEIGKWDGRGVPVVDDSDYDELPTGTLFFGDDGILRKKP